MTSKITNTEFKCCLNINSIFLYCLFSLPWNVLFCLYFYLNRLSCLCFLSTFYCSILESFVSSSLNYLEAYKSMYLLRNQFWGTLISVNITANRVVFISALNVLSKNCWTSFAHTELPPLLNPPLMWDLRTK